MLSTDELVVWLESFALRDLPTTYREYETGFESGQTIMARGVLSALDRLDLSKKNKG